MAKHGLAPLLCPDPIVLVLGSLPGDESIRRQEYYGNPRNMFWRVLAAVFEDAVPETYPEKKAFLTRHHVALWDVYASAERRGSLDANIHDITPNDISGFLKEHPSIKAIALNGGKSARAFKTVLSVMYGRSGKCSFKWSKIWAADRNGAAFSWSTMKSR